MNKRTSKIVSQCLILFWYVCRVRSLFFALLLWLQGQCHSPVTHTHSNTHTHTHTHTHLSRVPSAKKVKMPKNRFKIVAKELLLPLCAPLLHFLVLFFPTDGSSLLKWMHLKVIRYISLSLSVCVCVWCKREWDILHTRAHVVISVLFCTFLSWKWLAIFCNRKSIKCWHVHWKILEIYFFKFCFAKNKILKT